MSWDALKQLFGGGKKASPPANEFMGPMPDSWELLAQHQGAADRQMRQGQMLQQIGQQIGGSGSVGWLPALAQILTGVAGNRLQSKADEKASDLIARQFKLQNEDAARKAEAEARAEEEKYQRELRRQRDEAADPVLNPQKPREPIKIGNQLVMLDDSGKAQVIHTTPRAPQQPQGPSELERRIALARDMGASPDDLRALVLGGGQGRASPQDREGAKLDAGRIKEAEERARAAQKTLANVEQLESLLGTGMSTGPLDQYLPGRDRRLFDSLAADLNLSTLRQNFGGNPTEGERAANAATLPGIQQYEDNNRELLAKLRKEAQAKIAELDALRAGPAAAGGQYNDVMARYGL